MAQNQFGNKSIGENKWKPHIWNIATNPCAETSHSRVPGPDWTSKVRCIESSREPRPLENKRVRGRQHFPWRDVSSSEEWSFYWDGSRNGKRNFIDGEYKSNLQTTNEVFLQDAIGTKHKVIDPRGGIPCRAPGDKKYSIPDYSEDFHTEGSTLPAVNFGRSSGFVADTFIPVEKLPKQESETFAEKEIGRKLEEEKLEVKLLSDWVPAEPLNASLP